MDTVSQGNSIALGEADFDLAHYVNNSEIKTD